MKHEQSLHVLWTEGGNPGNAGYFDGAGALNELLLGMFAGREGLPERLRPPIQVDVMGTVPYETPVKITVTIETQP